MDECARRADELIPVQTVGNLDSISVTPVNSASCYLTRRGFSPSEHVCEPGPGIDHHFNCLAVRHFVSVMVKVPAPGLQCRDHLGRCVGPDHGVLGAPLEEHGAPIAVGEIELEIRRPGRPQQIAQTPA